MPDLQKQFGSIDIYLFDQILRGRIPLDARILDAGCGTGRNLVYFFQAGYEVFGVDEDREAIGEVRQLSKSLAPALPTSNFQVGQVEALVYEAAFFDFVISSAVLHFAKDDEHFRAMLQSMWRVLKVHGILFCRLASSIGMDKKVKRVKGRRYLLPDGSERYLVDAYLLTELADGLGAETIDPIKSTIVQKQRCMTTWVLRKPVL